MARIIAAAGAPRGIGVDLRRAAVALRATGPTRWSAGYRIGWRARSSVGGRARLGRVSKVNRSAREEELELEAQLPVGSEVRRYGVVEGQGLVTWQPASRSYEQ